MHPLDEFKRDVAGYPPGLLVLFDIVDAKRRNSHLGHAVVDSEIEELDRLIRNSVGSSGVAKRVGGDEWLALYKTGSADPVAAVVKAYHNEQEFLVGWRSTGAKDGQIKIAERTVRSRLVRSLRCIYSSAEASQDIGDSIDSLLEQNFGLPPDAAIELADAFGMERRRWSCVTDYPSESPFCPFCLGTEFDWEDGGTGVYAASGACTGCGASVDITGIELFG